MTRTFGNPWLRLVAFLVLLVLGVWGLLAVLRALTPFLIAFALAYFLNPGVNALERLLARSVPFVVQRRLPPRAVAVGLLAFFTVAAAIVVVAVVVPAVYHQAADAAARLPEYARVVRGRLEPLYQRLNLKYPEQMETVRGRIEETIRNEWPRILEPARRALQAAFSSLLGFVLAVLNLVVVPVFTFYLLFDMNRIRAGLADLVPHRFRPYVYSRTAEVDEQLSGFVRGQITVCLILGTFYAISLTLCGVPMGLLTGLFVGFLNLVPFMSFALGLPLTLVLSWVQDQDGTRLLVVAGVFLFGQIVEGNFITPRIVGERLGLHALVVMLAVIVGGTLFGFPGMLLAVPVTAALSVFWTDLRGLYLRSDFYRRSAPPESAG